MKEGNMLIVFVELRELGVWDKRGNLAVVDPTQGKAALSMSPYKLQTNTSAFINDLLTMPQPNPLLSFLNLTYIH